MADLQLQQQDPVLRPVLGQGHQETLHAGVGAAVPSTVPEEWDLPSWAG